MKTMEYINEKKVGNNNNQQKKEGNVMKKIIAITMVAFVALIGVPSSWAGFGTSANLTVNCTVASIFGFSTTDNPVMNFAVDENTPTPDAQSLELYATNNGSNPWFIKVAFDSLANTSGGAKPVATAPFVNGTLPQDGAANGYTNAQGTITSYNAPQLAAVPLYTSNGAEVGENILVNLTVRPLGMAAAPAGTYATTITITMTT